MRCLSNGPHLHCGVLPRHRNVCQLLRRRRLSCSARRKRPEVVPEDDFVEEEYIGEEIQSISMMTTIQITRMSWQPLFLQKDQTISDALTKI